MKLNLERRSSIVPLLQKPKPQRNFILSALTSLIPKNLNPFAKFQKPKNDVAPTKRTMSVRPAVIGSQTKLLLPRPDPEDIEKKCLVLDLDETLIHSSFEPVENADFIIPIVLNETVHKVFVLKRPGVDEFIAKLSELYELVVFTASLDKVSFTC